MSIARNAAAARARLPWATTPALSFDRWSPVARVQAATAATEAIAAAIATTVGRNPILAASALRLDGNKKPSWLGEGEDGAEYRRSTRGPAVRPRALPRGLYAGTNGPVSWLETPSPSFPT